MKDDHRLGPFAAIPACVATGAVAALFLRGTGAPTGGSVVLGYGRRVSSRGSTCWISTA